MIDKVPTLKELLSNRKESHANIILKLLFCVFYELAHDISHLFVSKIINITFEIRPPIPHIRSKMKNRS